MYGMAGLLPTTNALSTLLGSGGMVPYAGMPSPVLGGMVASQPHKWFYVIRRFGLLLENLRITAVQAEDGHTKQAGVRACLNRNYWGNASETANSLLIGSWGKLTRVRPSRDVDILFLLPPQVYHQYQARIGNRQSQLLQEVKAVLSQTYGETTMRGDGQVVVVPFKTIPIEIAPGFRCQDGSIIICDANDGGRYITSTAEAEAADLTAADMAFNGNARALVRMMKQWQRERNVPLKSFQLERLAIEFLRGWSNSMQSLFWYDWMVRDFFAYLIARANGAIIMPGTGEIVALGNDWLTRAQTSYNDAIQACIHEEANRNILAGEAWQKIFGTPVPLQVA
jgi:hypothetical protein